MHKPISNRVLGSIIGADFNVTTDQGIVIACPKFYIETIWVTNASISLTTAVGGFYTGAGKTGTTLVAASQVYSALTAPSKIMAVTMAAVNDTLTVGQIYFALTTAQGAAATADVFVLGWPFYE
jgi:hypothetical protein